MTTPVIVFLSGSRRGATLRLSGSELRIGTDPACDVRLPLDTAPLPLPVHATLTARGETYELVAEPGARVWVNGEPVDRLVLASGDVLEIGRDGAILRFRLYPPDAGPYRSLPEVFSDCLECARAERGVVRKAGVLATTIPRELATRTSPRFRRLMVLALVVLAGAVAFQARRGYVLERRLSEELARLDGVSRLLDRATGEGLDVDELGEVLAQLEGGLAERVEALEAASTAAGRIIADASQATLFLQGGYGFFDPVTDRSVRLVLGPGGRPITNARGHPALALDGAGPPLEVFMTGTGFLASPEGLVVTNRHVAEPWAYDEAATSLLEAGFEGRTTRFVGYLPGHPDPLDVSVAEVSDDEDVAVLLCPACVGGDVEGGAPFLPLAEAPPAPGDGIVLVGYPLGLRALLARSDPGFVGALRAAGIVDFWGQAHQLARAGYVAPLASRGIVGQVTSTRVVYDAETTSGGSGGPVLSLTGEVVAVNSAILPEFGGSNLGVPAAAVRALLERVAGN